LPFFVVTRVTNLGKWMRSLFKRFHLFPISAQIMISEFISLKDKDEQKETNKNEILAM
jgi:hypothetical protein